MIGTKETNFLLNLPLSDRQMSRLRKVFASNSLVNIKLSKTQLSKIIQAGGFLGRLLEPYMKVGLPLIKNVLPRTPLTKSVLILLVLTAAASSSAAADTGIHKISWNFWFKRRNERHNENS